MNIVNKIYLLIFDLLQVGIAMNVILDFRLDFRKQKVISYTVFSILLLSSSFCIGNNTLYYNANLILCIVFSFWCFKNSKKRTFFSRMIVTVLVYMAVSSIDAIAYHLISQIAIYQTDSLELWGSIAGTISIVAASLFYKRLIHRKLHIETRKGILILSGSMLFLGILTAMFPILIADNNLRNSKFSLIFSMFSMTVIAACVLLIYFSMLNDEYRLQEEISREKEQLLHNYYNDILRNNIEIRKFRHDYKNHMRSIKYFIQMEKYQELTKYIDDMDTIFWAYSDNVQVGNDFVSAVLNDYIEKMKEIGIKMEVSGMVPEISKISEIDWSIILSNCISNALEAALKVEEVERIIRIQFSTLNNKLLIEVCNPIDKVPEILDGEMKTTKPDYMSHGFGIKNIKSSIEKYYGNLSYEIAENKKIIITRIILII